ncbi:MAG: hypothetical protein FJX30_00570 [Alphaproteobacteria bacterium]|nr:hypothetical protein [Alphaproteobacteria bacterium]
MKIFSKFAFIMTFGEIMGDSYFDTSSRPSDNAFYKKPDQDLSQKILPHLIASLSIGVISIMSQQFYKSLKDLKKSLKPQKKLILLTVIPLEVLLVIKLL